MGTSITFNRTGYDPFIDFIKAYAIICVLIGHTLPVDNLGYGLWAGMQVPLFVLVQVFHFYKKDNSKIRIKSLLERIVLPFFIFSVVQFCALLIIEGVGYKSLITRWLVNGGGYGPGSYYPLIYIQIAFLLPLFRTLFCKFNGKQLFGLFLLLAEGFEILCSIIQPTEWLFRLLAIRYIFLIYLGWIWATEGIRINKLTVWLSILSLISIIYFEYVAFYFEIDNEPWFFNTLWPYHRWPCYFYVAFLFVYLLNNVWRKINKNHYVEQVIKVLAQSSYEIFLVQMTSICICRALLPQTNSLAYIALIWFVSIFGGIGANYLFRKVLFKK